MVYLVIPGVGMKFVVAAAFLSSCSMVAGFTVAPGLALRLGSQRQGIASSKPILRAASPVGNNGQWRACIASKEDSISLPSVEVALSRADKAQLLSELFSAKASGLISSKDLKDMVYRVTDLPISKQAEVVEAVEEVLKSEETHETDIKNVQVARLIILAAAALYGTNFGSVKLLEDSMVPSLAAALRFSLAGVAMSPLLSTLRKEALVDGVAIGALVAMGYITQSLSLQTTDASTAAFLCSLAVVVCPIMDAFVGHKIEPKAILIAGIAAAGAAVLELGGTATPGMGDLLALGQPLFFGAGFCYTSVAMRKCPDQAGPLAALQVITVGLITMLWAVADAHGLPSAEVFTAAFSNPEVVAAIVWTGLVTTALTVFLETVALGSLASGEATVLFSSEPLWGTAFAYALLGEQVGSNTLIGGALIITACVGRVVEFKLPENWKLPAMTSNGELFNREMDQWGKQARASAMGLASACLCALPGGAWLTDSI